MYSEVQKKVSNTVADNHLSGKIIRWSSKPYCFTGLILNLLSGEQVVLMSQVLQLQQKLLSRHCFWGLIFGQCIMTHRPVLAHNPIQGMQDPSQFWPNSWVGYFIFSLNVKTVRDSFIQKVQYLKRNCVTPIPSVEPIQFCKYPYQYILRIHTCLEILANRNTWHGQSFRPLTILSYYCKYTEVCRF